MKWRPASQHGTQDYFLNNPKFHSPTYNKMNSKTKKSIKLTTTWHTNQHSCTEKIHKSAHQNRDQVKLEGKGKEWTWSVEGYRQCCYCFILGYFIINLCYYFIPFVWISVSNSNGLKRSPLFFFVFFLLCSPSTSFTTLNSFIIFNICKLIWLCYCHPNSYIPTHIFLKSNHESYSYVRLNKRTN